MTHKMLRAKIHRATVTQADVDYEGSITIDRRLPDATDPLHRRALGGGPRPHGQRGEVAARGPG